MTNYLYRYLYTYPSLYLHKRNWINISLLLTIILFWRPSLCWSLAVDEKLPLRILKVSDTKRTVLINRGIEDGLVVGDHARFYLTTGAVARGIIIKTSPSRSVWSIYRLISPDDIVPDKAMNLKITPAVKLTNDPTKALAREEMGTEVPPTVTLAEGSDDAEKDKVLTNEEKRDLQYIAKNVPDAVPYTTTKTWEVWGTFHLNALATYNSAGANVPGSSGNSRIFDMQLGMEKYFSTPDRWYNRFSLSPFFQYENTSYTNISGNTVGSSIMGGGIGLNWHPINSPLSVGRIIFLVGGSFSMGNASDNFNQANPPQLKGTYTAYSGGLGTKYYFGHSFGLRILLDYYFRSEKYPVSFSRDDYTKVVKGPRILLGLSYRL